ncbi:MAG TPA: sigma-E processing peptidase SpoIIGA [Syntrophomonadaceae bacterium]|mgnify:CR=1 FL=1|nr:sigma-E processing peptidase SpoIIGA [Syntrophomonadaceae bacterium]HQA06839.1 sigma-E processing peptidase SpoIIGA [Syntrophomonadaceae bacterium]HQE22771.1 sigma-E processing peptidase SpoIIGA [Syntrophomonadaceae bacterium]
MGSKVYADITFLVNFIMDFLILWVTVRLTGVPVSYMRIAIAAGLGGIYAVGYLLPELSLGYSLPLKVLFSVLLVIMAVLPRTWKDLAKSMLLFYGINFLVAGASIGSSYLVQSSYQLDYSFWWLMAGISCALLLGIFGKNWLTERVLPQLLKFPVQLTFDRNRCSGQGFVDTGNGLRDPLTNRPVIIAEYQLLRDCLPADFKSALEDSCTQEEMLDRLSQSSWANRLRLIPFTSIGKKNGLLVGIRADAIRVSLGKNNIKHSNMVIGIYQDKLSPEEHYQLLIPLEILENG